MYEREISAFLFNSGIEWEFHLYTGGWWAQKPKFPIPKVSTIPYPQHWWQKWLVRMNTPLSAKLRVNRCGCMEQKLFGARYTEIIFFRERKCEAVWKHMGQRKDGRIRLHQGWRKAQGSHTTGQQIFCAATFWSTYSSSKDAQFLVPGRETQNGPS